MTFPRRVLSAAPALAVGAAVLAVGTSAAPSSKARTLRQAHPRLVARPAKLAAAVRLAPGDQVQRLVELRRRGRGQFRAIYFVARAKGRSQLTTDVQNGLHVELRSCRKRWVPLRGGHAYRCSSKPALVMSPRPVVGRTRLMHLRLKGQRAVHLRLVVSLPARAGNALQGKTTSLRYSFVGVARTR